MRQRRALVLGDSIHEPALRAWKGRDRCGVIIEIACHRIGRNPILGEYIPEVDRMERLPPAAEISGYRTACTERAVAVFDLGGKYLPLRWKLLSAATRSVSALGQSTA